MSATSCEREAALADSAPVTVSIHTSGNGWWTTVSKVVEVEAIVFEIQTLLEKGEGEVEVLSDVDAYIDQEKADPERMEIICSFSDAAWDAARDGCIYSDPGFLVGVRKLFALNDYPSARKIGYAGSAKQGEHHVTLQPRSLDLMREIWRRRREDQRLPDAERGSNAPRVAYRMVFGKVPSEPINIHADRDIFE